MKSYKFKRVISILLIIFLSITSMNQDVFTVRAAAESSKKISIADGNILISDTGYKQSTNSDFSGATEIPWDGTYTIWGVNTSHYNVVVKSDKHVVTLWRLTTNGSISFEATKGNAKCFISDKVILNAGAIETKNGCSLTVTGEGRNSDTTYLQLVKDAYNNYPRLEFNFTPGNTVTDNITFQDLTFKVDVNSASGYYRLFYLSNSADNNYVKNFNVYRSSFSTISPGMVDVLGVSGGNAKNINMSDLNIDLDLHSLIDSNTGQPDNYINLKNITVESDYVYNIAQSYTHLDADNINVIMKNSNQALNSQFFKPDGWATTETKIQNSYFNYIFPSSTPNNSLSSTMRLFSNVKSGSKFVVSNSTILNNSVLDTYGSPSNTMLSDDKTLPITFDRVAFYGDKTIYSNIDNGMSPYGDKLYLYNLKVSDEPYQKYDVKIDSPRDEYVGQSAQLYSDSQGILRLYLTQGNCKIEATEIGGAYKYNADVKVDTNIAQNTANAIPSKIGTAVITPLINQDIKWSLDNTTWNNVTTDALGKFIANIPEDGSIYVVGNDPFLYHASITSGTVNSFTKELPKISNQSTNMKVIKDHTVTLYVTAAPSLPGNALSYEWYFNNSKIENEDQAVLNVQNMKDANIGSYYCKVIESNGLSVNSNPITLEFDTKIGNTTELENKVSSLESQVTDLNKQLNQITDQLNNKSEDLSKLETQNTELSNQLNIAKETIDSLKNIKSTLEDQLNSIIDELNDTKDALNQFKDDNKDKDTIIHNLNDKIADLNDKVAQLTNDNNTLQTRMNNLDTLISGIKAALGVENNDDIIPAIEALKTKVSKLTNDNEILDSKLKSANDEISNWKNKYDTLLSQKNNSDAELTAANERIIELESTKTVLENQIVDLNKLISNLNSKIDELSEKNSTGQSTIDSLKSDIILLTLQITNLENDSQTLHSNINSLNLQIAQLNELLDKIKNELGVDDNNNIIKAIKQLKDTISNKEAENKTLKDRIDTIDTDLQNEKDKNNSLNDTLDNLKSLVDAETNDDLKNKISEILKQLSKSNEKIDSLIVQKDSLTTQLNNLIQKNDELTKRVSELEDLLSKNDSELQKKVVELQKQVSSLDQDKKELDKSINKLENDVSSLSDQNNSLQIQVNKLQSLLDSANLTIDQLREQLAKSYADNQSIKSENDSLKKETAAYQEKIKELQDLINKGGNNDSTFEELKKKILDLETVSKQKDKDIAEAKNKIEEFMKQIAKLQSQLSQPTNSPTDTKNQDATIPVSEGTSITVSKAVSETVVIPEKNNNTVAAKEGWELTTDPYSNKWDTTIDNSASEGIYTFFTKGITSSVENGLKKKIVYARNKSNPDVIYVCSYDPSSVNDTNRIVSTFKSNHKNIVLANSENNNYDVEISGKLVFTVGADFGKLPKKAILYQLVPESEDFDPDGNWINVEGTTIEITGLSQPSRLYIKYVDSKDNYVVDKTVGFKPKVKKADTIPTITMNKTIYKGQTFNLRFDNLSKSTKTKFTTGDSTIATVDGKGAINGKKKGTTKIYCNMYVDGAIKSTVILKVTVKKVVDKEFNYNLAKYQPSLTALNTVVMYKRLEVGKTTSFELKNYDNVAYVSSNTKIATVDNKGVIKGIKKGSVTITILAYKGKTICSYQIVVRVDDGQKDKETSSYLK